MSSPPPKRPGDGKKPGVKLDSSSLQEAEEAQRRKQLFFQAESLRAEAREAEQRSQEKQARADNWAPETRWFLVAGSVLSGMATLGAAATLLRAEGWAGLVRPRAFLFFVTRPCLTLALLTLFLAALAAAVAMRERERGAAPFEFAASLFVVGFGASALGWEVALTHLTGPKIAAGFLLIGGLGFWRVTRWFRPRS